MESRKYCPSCNCFQINRVHRGFLKKVVLNSPPIYECQDCEAKFTSKDLEKNELKDWSPTT